MDTTDFAGVLWKECSWYLKCLYVIVAPFLLLYDMIFGTIGHLRVVQGYSTMRNGRFGCSCDLAMYSGHKIKTALTLLCSEDNVPALIVCNLGKDRTGVLCAIIEALCEVPEDTIAQDYSLSKDIGLQTYKRAVAQGGTGSKTRNHHKLLEVHRSQVSEENSFILKEEKVSQWEFKNVQGTFHCTILSDWYGSLAAYLESVGFNHEMQKTLVQNVQEKC